MPGGLDAEVDFRQGDALGELFPGQREQFDLIVSNPPYIPRREKASMRVNVTGYEPAEALFVEDDDPLIFYRAIARNARRLLRPGGRLYFEIHENFRGRNAPDADPGRVSGYRRAPRPERQKPHDMQPAKKIKRDKTPEQAYAALIRLCARSEKSSGDALRLMQRWGVEPSARQGVLQKLLADRFIDDNRYAEAFVRDKIRLSGWGARKIRTSLRLKGIAAAIIDEALARLDPANQSERLRTQLEKKLRLTRYKDTYDLKTKLIRYGLSLGYDYDAVLDAAGELIQTKRRTMRRLLISALLLCSAPVSAQHLAPEDYIFPLRDVAGLYSANFGEMRPNHFHSGIDIKTDGVTGKPVLATADGYISRIAVTPGGYGRAIYITHPNGTTSVYGHLSKFRDDIEKYVHEERYRTRRNSINLYPPADRFPLKQGEQFAWSGNTGSSAGPHLHFEIRDSRTQRTLNTISSGVIRTRDDIPPRLVKLYYVEVDSVRGVPVHARPRPVELVEKNTRTLCAQTGRSTLRRRPRLLHPGDDRPQKRRIQHIRTLAHT